eukprot:SAG31_NODE_1429_length_8390_cov_2.259076_6_plen_152_part_00
MLPLRLVAVGSAACAGSSVAQVDVAIIYDKGGKHGQCSEGPRSYMTDCAMPSDYFTYILSAEPTLAIGQTCASLGSCCSSVNSNRQPVLTATVMVLFAQGMTTSRPTRCFLDLSCTGKAGLQQPTHSPRFRCDLRPCYLTPAADLSQSEQA